MDEEEYLTKRLENQIQWYDNKSITSQRNYKWLKRVEFVISASIPIIALLPLPYEYTKVITATIGAILTVLAAIHGLSDFHEHWIEYRATAEELKHEKYLYLTKSGVYAENENSFTLLVERVEQLISKENATWTTHNSKVKNKV